jgi:hypothetical protein
MGEKSLTEETVANLDAQTAFKLIEFYENAASVVKGRTWSITTGILTINAALLAFSFQLYTKNSGIHGFLWIQAAICCVGVALCLFLYFLIRDQGKHLIHYWTNENKIGAWNSRVQDFILDEEELAKVREPGYQAPFPRFCVRLVFLSSMFATGFLGTFLLMWALTMTGNKG